MSMIQTTGEVILNSPLSKEYPKQYVSMHIKTVEQFVFTKKFGGYDFYKLLLDDVVDFSSVAEYDSSTTYNEEDQVLWYDVVYESTADSNTNEPDPDDLDGTDWQLADKFETTCYQSLWTEHLKEYLAFNVASRSLIYATIQAGSKGVVEMIDDDTGIRTASKQRYLDLKVGLSEDIEIRLQNMNNWVQDQRNEGICSFPNIESPSCASTYAPKNVRRIAFKR